MKVLLQRVSECSIHIDGKEYAAIKYGLLAFVCFEPGDNHLIADRMLRKMLTYRIFSDTDGKMNRSLQDIDGDLMLVSQFTLGADTQSGRRPSFSTVASPQLGKELYDYLVQKSKDIHPKTQQGCFGTDMKVFLINDGPVTFLLNHVEKSKK